MQSKLMVQLEDVWGAMQMVVVDDMSQAIEAFKCWRDSNAFGSRDMGDNAGLIRKNGHKVARIRYNGTVEQF